MKRPVIVSTLCIVTMIVSFLIPRPKYESLNVLQDLNVPITFTDWRSFDFSDKINLQDDRYNFISDVFARVYENRKGDQLLLLILDAGNFHNPKVCYTSSGFKVRENGKVDFTADDTTFKATSLFMGKKDMGMNMYYWLTIDKQIVDWTGQKVLELWSALSNKKKTGLMVRLEIPAQGRTEQQALALGRDFIKELNGELTHEQREYIFGK